MSSSAASVLSMATRGDARPVPRPYLAVCPAAPTNDTLSVAAPSHAAARIQSEMISMLPALRRRAWRWCRDDIEAEDLAQETVLRGLGAGPSFASESHVRAWLYTVLRNLFISRRRREQCAQRAFAELGATALAANDAAPSASFLSQSLQRALADLPEPFARVVRLVDLEEHTYAEAAALLGVPVGTVMSRLFRGRKRLALALGATEL